MAVRSGDPAFANAYRRRVRQRTLAGMIEIPLTEDEFAATAAQVEQQQGIPLTGTEGKITKMGVTAGYQYANGILRVTILDKPFFVSTDYCEEQLKAFLAKR